MCWSHRGSVVGFICWGIIDLLPIYICDLTHQHSLWIICCFQYACTETGNGFEYLKQILCDVLALSHPVVILSYFDHFSF